MREVKKIVFFLIIIVALLLLPSICKATDYTVADEDTLRNTLESAVTGDVITLTKDIVLTSPITITDKIIEINGNGHSISADDTWTSGTQGNQSLLTISTGANVTLRNLTLRDSKKYGVQAYDTGYVILDGVTLIDNNYGGVLVNGGNLEIVDVDLGRNGEENNVGIEISKGESAQRDPVIIMNGRLSSSESENVIWIAQNDNLDKFTLENTEETEYKLFSTGNQVLVADENNQIIYASNESEKQIEISPDESIESVIVTIHYGDGVLQFAVNKGDKLSSVDLTEVKEGIEGKEFVEFRVGTEKGEVFKEDTEITESIELMAVYKDIKKEEVKKPEEKDESDKNGMDNTQIVIASTLAILSLVGLVELKKNK